MLELPFEDASFDAATVGFGVRNVADLEAASPSCARVLQPGRPVGDLEITRPPGRCGLLQALVDVVPLLGKILPGGKAYTYLPASVRRFPGPTSSAGAAAAGVRRRRYRRLGGGIVALHTGARA